MPYVKTIKTIGKTFGPYSPFYQANGLYFVSGQVGMEFTGKQTPKGIDQQTHQVLKNLQRVLSEADLTLDNVVKTTIFLTNIDDFNVVNDIYVTYFVEPWPARSCVAVAALPKLGKQKLLIELEAIAVEGQA